MSFDEIFDLEAAPAKLHVLVRARDFFRFARKFKWRFMYGGSRCAGPHKTTVAHICKLRVILRSGVD